MNFPKTKAAWNRLQASSLREAFRLNKEYARKFKRLTVPAIAELVGISEDRLYKYLSNASMPTNLVPAYEHVCGVDFVTQYMAIRNHKILIEIPTGKKANEMEVSELQQISAEAISLLIKFYMTHEDLDKTTVALTSLISGIAFHKENIQTQPELDLEGGDE